MEAVGDQPADGAMGEMHEWTGAFNNSAAYVGGVNPGPASGGADHTYNDGYVLVDSSGNAGGLTWNWGYQNASQVVGPNMQFNAIQSSSPSGSAVNEVSDNPQYGAELTYQRVMGSLPFLPSGRWGPLDSGPAIG